MRGDSISNLLQGNVELKSNRIKRLWRIANRAPEVMIKVSGFSRSAGHIAAHFEYISRNGQLDVEDEQGMLYNDKETLSLLAGDWGLDATHSNSRSRHATHLILSMPHGTEPKAIKQAVRAFAHKTFSHNYQYVMALHTDTDSPHVHLTIKNLGFDDRKLHIKKGQPQIWREQFAAELEHLGIQAEATPRYIRGVIQKSISQAIMHMRNKGQTPIADKLKVRQAVELALDPNKKVDQPWQPKIDQRQTDTRNAWKVEASNLFNSDEPQQRAVAQDIINFLKTMPEVKTHQQNLNKQAEKFLQQNRQHDQHDDSLGSH